MVELTRNERKSYKNFKNIFNIILIFLNFEGFNKFRKVIWSYSGSGSRDLSFNIHILGGDGVFNFTFTTLAEGGITIRTLGSDSGARTTVWTTKKSQKFNYN